MREAKRRETYQRIAETGLRLFIEQGYDATTLEMIAEEAGISRRTFFAYFKSKDELLVAWQLNGWAMLANEVRRRSPDEPPLAAVRDVMLRRVGLFKSEYLKEVAKVMRSSEALMMTHHASFAERELMLYVALCDVWRQPERRLALRLIAMAAVGALRVAVERWEEHGNKRSLQRLLNESFDALGELSG